MNKKLGYKIVTALGFCLSQVGIVAADTPTETNNSKELYIYNWTEYIPTEVIDDFVAETGIKVRYLTYESNEEMYAKLKLVNGKGYDLIFPSSYYIKTLVNDGLIQKLDKTKIDFTQVLPNLLGRNFDPQNEYSIPYSYGFTLIGYNKHNVNGKEITSWADLWKPKYTNLTFPNDVIDNFSIALLKDGVNPNKATRSQIDKAYKSLQNISKRVVQFNSDSTESPFIEGVSDLGVIWSGSAFRTYLDMNKSINVVYPKEGAILWIDNFALSSQAKNVDNAYKFINFILRPDISVRILYNLGFQTSNKGLRDLVPTAWKNNPILFPPDEAYQKAIMNEIKIEDIPYYTNLWNKLRAE